MKLNIDLKSRFKNYMTYISFIAIIFNAADIEVSMLTSWPIVFEAITSIFMNPFVLFTTILAVLGVVCDTSTPGLGDGK